jgi:phosphomevalonate kinase
MKVSAHGKVFLAGEYAVLDGSPALVMGIDRDLHASSQLSERTQVVRGGLVWDGGPAPEELRFAARAARICGMPLMRVTYEDELPKGLGSSAAATVAAVRAFKPGASDDEVLALSVAAHWAEQGGSGSGADVAASALGGVIEVRSRIPWRSAEEAMASPRQSEIRTKPIAVSPDARFLLAFTKQPADTRVLVRKVRELIEGDPRQWLKCKAEIENASFRLVVGLKGAPEHALDGIRRGATAMAQLGLHAGAPIVTDELAHICALASSAGAAGKPSGAGGGDCAVILAFGDEARDRAEAAIQKHFPVQRIAPVQRVAPA